MTYMYVHVQRIQHPIFVQVNYDNIIHMLLFTYNTTQMQEVGQVWPRPGDEHVYRT